MFQFLTWMVVKMMIPFRFRIIMGMQKGTITLTTTHMDVGASGCNKRADVRSQDPDALGFRV